MSPAPHQPLRVTAWLAHPGVLRDAPMLDGLLLAGEAARVSADVPGGVLPLDATDALPLPLARVEVPGVGWWWAASAAHLHGPERGAYGNRRPPLHLAERLTAERSLNVVSGPDKMLRQPLPYRPAMLRLEFTCIGDPAGVGAALAFVGGVGHRRTHGWGWILRWEVEADPDGPRLADYATDIRLRHLPMQTARLPPPVAGQRPARAVSRLIPLTPPYWHRPRAVPCLAIAPSVGAA